MRLPLYLRKAIDQTRKTRTVTGWIIEAIQEKLQRESRQA